MIPVFSKGKDVQRTTSEAVGIGAKQIPTTDASSYFIAGQRLFISQPDGSDVEFLGVIQAVDTGSVSVELATAAAKVSGANLWTPLAFFECPAGREASFVRTRKSGVEVVRSLGGTAYATRLHEPYEIEHAAFQNLTDERFAELSAWIETEADNGLEEFTYVDAARNVRRVNIDVPTLEWQRTAEDLIAAGFDLHLLEESIYA